MNTSTLHCLLLITNLKLKYFNIHFARNRNQQKDLFPDKKKDLFPDKKDLFPDKKKIYFQTKKKIYFQTKKMFTAGFFKPSVKKLHWVGNRII